jgi:hypothetical protein
MGTMNNAMSLVADRRSQLQLLLSAVLCSVLLVSAMENANRACARSASRDISLIKTPVSMIAAARAEGVIR